MAGLLQSAAHTNRHTVLVVASLTKVVRYDTPKTNTHRLPSDSVVGERGERVNEC